MSNQVILDQVQAVSPDIGQQLMASSGAAATAGEDSFKRAGSISAFQRSGRTGTTVGPAPQSKTSLVKRICSPANLRFGACCLQGMVAGWNDACAGALIPYMEAFYHINFVEVSTLFIGAFCGFIAAAILNNGLTDRLGMGRVLTIGAVMQTIGYGVITAPPPFPLFPVTYAILIGFGIALQMAQTVSYITNLPDASVKINYSQSAYGIGAMLSPLAATALVSHGVRFSYFFAVSLGLSFVNTLTMFLAFWRDAEYGAPRSHTKPQDSNAETGAPASFEMDDVGGASSGIIPSSSSTGLVHETMSTSQKNRAILSQKITWLCALFLCCYVGAEVSIGGWAVSFLLEERGGNKNVGYVSTGFWTGITIGRLTLPRLQAKLGDRTALYLFISLSVLLQFSVWFWRNLVGNAVAICVIGFLISTFFGIGVMTMTKILPKHLHTGAIGLVAAAGQAGSAAFPFLTGALAQRFGPVALQPVVIVLLFAMALVWAFVPNVDRRKE